MTTRRLTRLTVTDFRSIRGKIEIPLDAPVVLIYGTNGVGKTSVLSAIELGLTGHLRSLEGASTTWKHLVHEGADNSIVSVESDDIGAAASQMTVTGRGAVGTPLLGAPEQKFFTERCYLPQSLLTRLLDIYQGSTVREESPLTQFVKELLGLDALEAIIDGLNATRDVRNLRKVAPEFDNAERYVRQLEEQIKFSGSELGSVEAEYRAQVLQLLDNLAAFDVPPVPTGKASEWSRIVNQLVERSASGRLRREMTFQRQVDALQDQYTEAKGSVEGAEESEAELTLATASRSADAWHKSSGATLSATLAKLQAYFPGLVSVERAGPLKAAEDALRFSTQELDRIRLLVGSDDQVKVQILEAARGYEAAVERRNRCTALMAELADPSSLLQVLSSIAVHIDSEICPVCERDWSDVSDIPLRQKVAVEVARLGELSSRLGDLTVERDEASLEAIRLSRLLETLNAEQLSASDRLDLLRQQADLRDLTAEVETQLSSAATGEELVRQALVAREGLSRIRNRRSSIEQVRVGLRELTPLVRDGGEMADEESTEETLLDLKRTVETRVAALITSEDLLQVTLGRAREVVQLATAVESRKSALDSQHAAIRTATARLEEMSGRRASARAVADAALTVRTKVVQDVFGGTLNHLWRDLFVRLAPNESFIPAFSIPSSNDRGSVLAELETVHRSGEQSGPPGAMLSAGNLNTAALTLFLALHLSVPATLPWLILDDPVQSMDDVHIVHLASLLKNLSKDHGRQIVIAVHDRELFDYLSFELTPAFEGDRLITIKMSRGRDGSTTSQQTIHGWEEASAAIA
jgi:exonuclease SbcC